MKNKISIIIVTFAIIALGISAWLYGYYHNKSNDNLPDLASIAAMDEADVNELLTGYRKIQLREVWREPDKTGSNEDVWIIGGKTSLIVNYSDADKVVICKFNAED